MILIPPRKEQLEEKIEPLAVSTAEAAKMLGVCERTVCNLAKKGKIVCKKIGWRSIFPVASIRAYLESPDTE